MDTLFFLLFLVSLISLIIGLIRPNVFSHFLKERVTRKVVAKVFGITTVVSLFLLGMTSDSPAPSTKYYDSTTQEQTRVSKTEQIDTAQQVEEVVPDYEIVHELSKARFDGGKSFYVLVSSINLSSNAFKDDIKNIFRDIVSKKGNKISIEIYDNRASLDLSYKQYGDMTLGRTLNQNELNNRALHLIATYDGNLSTNIYTNTLSFFPGAFKDTATVGKFVETVAFNASN